MLRAAHRRELARQEVMDRVGRERAELTDLVESYRRYKDVEKQAIEAEELRDGSDPELAQMAQEELARLGADYRGRGVGIVAISSNDAAKYPDDAPERLKQMAAELGFTFPVCFDETQEVAKAYTAACTPDFFLFDRARTLVYRGQLDGSRPENGEPVTGRDLRAAIDAVLSDRPVGADQRPSIGCNIKWKPGNEPRYFGAPR